LHVKHNEGILSRAQNGEGQWGEIERRLESYSSGLKLWKIREGQTGREKEKMKGGGR